MTYWGKCSFDKPELGLPWNDQLLPNRGSCAFSNREYNVGDLILVETPLITCFGHHPFTDHQLEEIGRNINLLTDVERTALFSMANSVPSTDNQTSKYDDFIYEAANIFITNSFDMTGNLSGDSCAIYCAIGRLNHSCYPNVQVSSIVCYHYYYHYYYYISKFIISQILYE